MRRAKMRNSRVENAHCTLHAARGVRAAAEACAHDILRAHRTNHCLVGTRAGVNFLEHATRWDKVRIQVYLRYYRRRRLDLVTVHIRARSASVIRRRRSRGGGSSGRGNRSQRSGRQCRRCCALLLRRLEVKLLSHARLRHRRASAHRRRRRRCCTAVGIGIGGGEDRAG